MKYRFLIFFSIAFEGLCKYIFTCTFLFLPQAISVTYELLMLNRALKVDAVATVDVAKIKGASRLFQTEFPTLLV